MKYLLLFGFLAAVWWFVKKRQVNADRPVSPVEPPATNMRRCLHCGVNFPENDGVIVQGRAYCSEAHQRAANSSGQQ